jgi:hypothetical protein
MTQSNSKLTKEQKADLHNYIASYPGNVEFAIIGRTTIAYEQVGDLVEFSTAICAASERKFRKSVGKLTALERLYDGHCIKLPAAQFEAMIDAMQREAEIESFEAAGSMAEWHY